MERRTKVLDAWNFQILCDFVNSVYIPNKISLLFLTVLTQLQSFIKFEATVLEVLRYKQTDRLSAVSSDLTLFAIWITKDISWFAKDIS